MAPKIGRKHKKSLKAGQAAGNLAEYEVFDPSTSFPSTIVRDSDEEWTVLLKDVFQMDGNYTFFIILCFQTWSLSCERMTTPCWSTRFWICSSRPPCASSQSRTYYEYFFALKDVICIILRILLWGKLALWSNLCVLIHKWEKSSLCGMGKKIGNGPPLWEQFLHIPR